MTATVAGGATSSRADDPQAVGWLSYEPLAKDRIRHLELLRKLTQRYLEVGDDDKSPTKYSESTKTNSRKTVSHQKSAEDALTSNNNKRRPFAVANEDGLLASFVNTTTEAAEQPPPSKSRFSSDDNVGQPQKFVQGQPERSYETTRIPTKKRKDQNTPSKSSREPSQDAATQSRQILSTEPTVFVPVDSSDTNTSPSPPGNNNALDAISPSFLLNPEPAAEARTTGAPSTGPTNPSKSGFGYISDDDEEASDVTGSTAKENLKPHLKGGKTAAAGRRSNFAGDSETIHCRVCAERYKNTPIMPLPSCDAEGNGADVCLSHTATSADSETKSTAAEVVYFFKYSAQHCTSTLHRVSRTGSFLSPVSLRNRKSDQQSADDSSCLVWQSFLPKPMMQEGSEAFVVQHITHVAFVQLPSRRDLFQTTQRHLYLMVISTTFRSAPPSETISTTSLGCKPKEKKGSSAIELKKKPLSSKRPLTAILSELSLIDVDTGIAVVDTVPLFGGPVCSMRTLPQIGAILFVVADGYLCTLNDIVSRHFPPSKLALRGTLTNSSPSHNLVQLTELETILNQSRKYRVKREGQPAIQGIDLIGVHSEEVRAVVSLASGASYGCFRGTWVRLDPLPFTRSDLLSYTMGRKSSALSIISELAFRSSTELQNDLLSLVLEKLEEPPITSETFQSGGDSEIGNVVGVRSPTVGHGSLQNTVVYRSIADHNATFQHVLAMLDAAAYLNCPDEFSLWVLQFVRRAKEWEAWAFLKRHLLEDLIHLIHYNRSRGINLEMDTAVEKKASKASNGPIGGSSQWGRSIDTEGKHYRPSDAADVLSGFDANGSHKIGPMDGRLSYNYSMASLRLWASEDVFFTLGLNPESILLDGIIRILVMPHEILRQDFLDCYASAQLPTTQTCPVLRAYNAAPINPLRPAQDPLDNNRQSCETNLNNASPQTELIVASSDVRAEEALTSENTDMEVEFQGGVDDDLAVDTGTAHRGYQQAPMDDNAGGLPPTESAEIDPALMELLTWILRQTFSSAKACHNSTSKNSDSVTRKAAAEKVPDQVQVSSHGFNSGALHIS